MRKNAKHSVHRVNMYASAWICTKQAPPARVESPTKRRSPRILKSSLSTLEEIDLGLPMVEEDNSIRS